MTVPTPVTLRYSIMRTFLALLGIAFAVSAYGQDAWPSRPIRFILPFPPGGGTDILGRLIGERLSASLGQPVVVDNRGGGNGFPAALAVKAAPADGYTILFGSNSTLATNLALFKSVTTTAGPAISPGPSPFPKACRRRRCRSTRHRSTKRSSSYRLRFC